MLPESFDPLLGGTLPPAPDNGPAPAGHTVPIAINGLPLTNAAAGGQPIPGPGTVALLLGSLTGWGLFRRQRRA